MFSKSLKAQTSLEYLFVTIFALIIVAGTLASFGQINNSTAAIALIKSKALSELNKEEKLYTIKKIEELPAVNGVAQFILVLEPVDYATNDLLATILETEIKNKGLYKNISVTVT